MITETSWTSLEIAKLVVSSFTPLMVAFAGYWISKQLTQSEEIRRQQYEERKERERLEREERKDQLERRREPHIELSIDCEFFGPRQRLFLANFLVIANNRGHVVHQFPKILLRVRGIKVEPFQYWQDRTPRAYFPHKIFETDLVPPNWNFVYVEPGVTHQIAFTTIIPAEYSYLLAYAEFDYKEYWPHSAEAIFAVPSSKA